MGHNMYMVHLGVKAVRDSAKTNMMDRDAVMHWANEMGFWDTVVYIDEIGKGKYMSLLQSVPYDELPEINTQELLELARDTELQREAIKQYKK